MRRINVKTHTRKLSSGKCTTVTHHQRHKPFHISYEKSSFDEVESDKFDVFEELAELNQKDSKNFRQYMDKYGGIEQISDINHFNKYFKSFKSSIDSDNDGVIDRLDCKPFDKSMQGVKLSYPEIEKLTKGNFFQYKSMAQRFIDGDGIAIVRNGDDLYQHKVYILDNDGEIQLLSDNAKRVNKIAKELIQNVYFDKPSEFAKKLEERNILPSLFLNNYLTNGYASAVISRLISRGIKDNNIFKRYIDKMENSERRHLTDYDFISKKDMSNQEVAELRREYTS